MVDHNVDEVVMVRRLSNGEPDHPGGFVRIVDDETAAAVDKVQLDAIEANARGRAEVVPGGLEPPEELAGVDNTTRRVGTVARDVNAGVHAVGVVSRGLAPVPPGAKAEAGLTDIRDDDGNPVAGPLAGDGDADGVTGSSDVDGGEGTDGVVEGVDLDNIRD